MLDIVPTTLAEANAYVEQHHRHHGPVVGHLYSMAVAEGGRVCGVAIVGRPVSRMLDNGWTVEVTRLATDGTAHAPSKLYAACQRAAFALGYRRVVTYTLTTEPGTSLRAVGWKCVGEVRGRSWSCPSRPRIDKTPWQAKLRWESNATITV